MLACMQKHFHACMLSLEGAQHSSHLLCIASLSISSSTLLWFTFFFGIRCIDGPLHLVLVKNAWDLALHLRRCQRKNSFDKFPSNIKSFLLSKYSSCLNNIMRSCSSGHVQWVIIADKDPIFSFALQQQEIVSPKGIVILNWTFSKALTIVPPLSYWFVRRCAGGLGWGVALPFGSDALVYKKNKFTWPNFRSSPMLRKAHSYILVFTQVLFSLKEQHFPLVKSENFCFLNHFSQKLLVIP